MLIGHDKDVHGGDRLDVAEGSNMLILVHDGGRDLFLNDLAEEAISHGFPSVIRFELQKR
jgi:hypothetical protein